MSAQPPLGPPPAGGDQDRGPQLMAMFWVETILAIAILSARFYVRHAIRGLGPDDWMMLITVVSFESDMAFRPRELIPIRFCSQ